MSMCKIYKVDRAYQENKKSHGLHSYDSCVQNHSFVESEPVLEFLWCDNINLCGFQRKFLCNSWFFHCLVAILSLATSSRLLKKRRAIAIYFLDLAQLRCTVRKNLFSQNLYERYPGNVKKQNFE
jgi:hypothetical protein